MNCRKPNILRRNKQRQQPQLGLLPAQHQTVMIISMVPLPLQTSSVCEPRGEQQLSGDKKQQQSQQQQQQRALQGLRPIRQKTLEQQTLPSQSTLTRTGNEEQEASPSVKLEVLETDTPNTEEPHPPPEKKVSSRTVLHKCLECSRTFPELSLAKEHMEREEHSAGHSMVHNCSVCDLEFSTKSQLENHHHAPETTDREEEHACNVCGKVMASKLKLKLHFLSHRDNLTFFCNVCGGEFTLHKRVPSNLQTKAMVLTCNNCLKIIRRRGTPRRIAKAPEGHLPFPCSLCSRSFRNQHALNCHRSFHVTARPATCPACNRKYRNNCLLRAHLRNAHKLQGSICLVRDFLMLNEEQQDLVAQEKQRFQEMQRHKDWQLKEQMERKERLRKKRQVKDAILAKMLRRQEQQQLLKQKETEVKVFGEAGASAVRQSDVSTVKSILTGPRLGMSLPVVSCEYPSKVKSSE